jgi:hypothetical protein
VKTLEYTIAYPFDLREEFASFATLEAHVLSKVKEFTTRRGGAKVSKAKGFTSPYVNGKRQSFGEISEKFDFVCILSRA